jgi:hypothetical protein
VTRRVVVVPLTVPSWCPPGIDPRAWREALAEDVVDLLATLASVTPAIAVVPEDRPVAEAVAWPGTRIYELPVLTSDAIFAAAAGDGYEQAALIAPDAPDLPGMLVGKLLRPLSSRPVSVAPSLTGGLLGLAARLPVPAWLPALDLDAGVEDVRKAAPEPGQVGAGTGWHRLTGPAGLARLDPGLEGWEATRALLGGQDRGSSSF